MKTNITSKLWVSTLAITILATAACKKNHDEVLPDKPMVTTIDSKKGMDTVTIGNAITLRPALSSKAGVTFSWTINGVEKGKDSVFIYTPDTRGDVLVNFKATNAGGSATADYHVHVYGKYENGFFMINEGWFGHGDGSVSFFRYDTQTKEDSVFTKENPGKNLDPTTSTLESGTIFNDKLFLVAKVSGPVVVTDAYSLKELGRIPSTGGNNWQAFVGIDNTKGLLSSGKGLYPFDLTTYTVGTLLTSITGDIGDVKKAGNYIFVLSQSQGVVILNASDYSVAKKIPGMQVAFTQTPDGSVWAAGGTSLIKINPSTLDVTTVTVPFTVSGSWAAWHPGSITASTKDNTIYLAKNGSFSGATTIYKYTDGNAASLQSPFITIATGKELYGAGVAYNAATNQLVVNSVHSGFTTNYAINDLDFYNASTGVLIKDIPFSGYYFPATYVFH